MSEVSEVSELSEVSDVSEGSKVSEVRSRIIDLEKPIYQHALLAVSGDTKYLHHVHLWIVLIQKSGYIITLREVIQFA